MSKRLINGQDVVIHYANITKNPDAPAKMLGFQLDLTVNREKETENVQYKGGSVNNNTGEEVSYDISSILYATDDVNGATWEEWQQIYEDDDTLGLWVTDITKGVGEVEPTYTVGKLSNFNIEYPIDGEASLDTSYNVDGKPVKGMDQLTSDMIDEVTATQVEYRKLVKDGI